MQDHWGFNGLFFITRRDGAISLFMKKDNRFIDYLVNRINQF
jgi:hypothetical protein